MRDKDKKILIFGGTTEGRELASALLRADVSHVVSVATDYGKEIENSCGEDNVIVGRKDANEMAKLISDEGFTVCVDATHPFATLVSGEIKKACERTGAEYLRLLRDTGARAASQGSGEKAEGLFRDAVDEASFMVCDSVDAAADELEKTEGNILLLTGSKDLKSIVSRISDVSRVYARVLPYLESITKCEEAGLKGKQIIAMQGPFSKDMNIALIKEIGASVILTKESGAAGGLDEKLFAAKECGIKAVMIKSPESVITSEGHSLTEILDKVGVKDIEAGIERKIITLAGIGPGDSRYYTRELEEALKKADVIFGAKSILERVDKSGIKAHFEPLYMGKDILEFLEKRGLGEDSARSGFHEGLVESGFHGREAKASYSEYKHPLALFSGDISLCSGAKSAAIIFENAGYEVHKISGISSIALFANRLGLGLEDCDVVSAHGRDCNVLGYALCSKKLIVLPSSCAHAGQIARAAQSENREAAVLAMPDKGDEAIGTPLRIVLGYELGTEAERVFEVTENELGNDIFSPDEKGKCLLFIENRSAGESPVIRGIPDDEFIRGKTPMTKEEVRAISIRKLGLSSDSVLYDVGAGTGSVSVEAALLHPDIKVYSIERNDEAIDILEKNKEKFGADNINIIKGEAPAAFEELPSPTHAFIGGSGGNLKAIIKLLKKKNENVRIVINCITLETLTETLSVIKEMNLAEPDIVQLSASRYKKVGDYHMPDAINPVYIISIC
ncbi:precorrin-6Y C5,15-methyltransferase (decarboxylating) subunit CbiT [Butyrivibrio sp. INlla21]|uniref:precorrin-6Y C5,15-methyltransferase (decarboxylating) subunit CbiT n=1 Tax=Butyrivibrio sp. INlla21 TaxID=1520811 RepID=UPI0008F3982A|nr:precorrin-6Y C5,15-methyltransferase (decarboxylating) subunit CbiT [Butyrivibrio sp. INlla21]SFU34418.1 precorrin-6Y C5,15-methyltransferase (decarboxylating) [Butyrivibrio sp. INlla21]